MRRVFLVIMALGFIAGTAPAAVVIANPDLHDLRLTEHHLRDAMLGRVSTWADGQPISLVLVDDETAGKAMADIAGRDVAQLMRGWKRLVYAGSGAMPTVVTSERAALDEVRRRPGAITVLATDPHDKELCTITLAHE